MAESDKIPAHLAIIMDGNNRWAKKRVLPTKAGHKKGAETAKNTVKSCLNKGIKYLTLYTFSSENWNRPEDEINDILTLLRGYLKNEAPKLLKENISIRFIGDLSAFPQDIYDLCKSLSEKSEDKQHQLTVNIALNYGSRQEIINAANRLLNSAKTNIDIEDFEAELYTKDIPDPDLLIRTGGDKRISNFLLWQSAYTEFYFCETLWPDFDEAELNAAIEDYSKRERRFGSR